MQERAFERSERWSDFYLDSAALAMRRGRREQAAFLLGYALHNRQDLGAHRGMPAESSWEREEVPENPAPEEHRHQFDDSFLDKYRSGWSY